MITTNRSIAACSNMKFLVACLSLITFATTGILVFRHPTANPACLYNCALAIFIGTGAFLSMRSIKGSIRLMIYLLSLFFPRSLRVGKKTEQEALHEGIHAKLERSVGHERASRDDRKEKIEELNYQFQHANDCNQKTITAMSSLQATIETNKSTVAQNQRLLREKIAQAMFHKRLVEIIRAYFSSERVLSRRVLQHHTAFVSDPRNLSLPLPDLVTIPNRPLSNALVDNAESSGIQGTPAGP